MDVGPSVQDTLALVYRLQTIDSELAHITQELEASRDALRKKEESLEGLVSLMETEKIELLRLARDRRDREDELRTNEHIISENKKKNKELKHSREIQAFLAEMEFRRDEVERLQDEILRIMETQETLDKALKDREKEIAEKRDELETSRTTAREEAAARMDRVRNLEEEKVRLSDQFPDALFQQYSRLQKSHRNGLVVSRIQNGTCEVCRMTLPPRTLTEVKKRQKIVPCLHCQRWLFLEEIPTGG
ncbi:MAG: C4-type zinc ribbon domain-containing protein [Nitrospirae bacterium]|nr:C4-type zinc ribbon domain-containing protein [Nitrospirota bacterium]MCL5285229.1 C4-type zinc ribbon domain-containing protein [Nitrospirota bacterium]